MANTNCNTPLLLTSKEAAAMLRVSRRTLEAMRLRGEGPTFIRRSTSRNGRVAYSLTDIELWISSHTVVPENQYANQHPIPRTYLVLQTTKKDGHMFEPSDPVLSTKEAARYVGLSPSTLANLRVTGSGPRFVKTGPNNSRVLYRQSALKKWLDSRNISSTAEAKSLYGIKGPLT